MNPKIPIDIPIALLVILEPIMVPTAAERLLPATKAVSMPARAMVVRYAKVII